MRRPRRHILLACWLVVQLLFGQQLALAHMVGHVGDALAHAVAGADAGASEEDSEHGGAEALTHVCSACASGLGADMLPAAGRFARVDPGSGDQGLSGAVSPAPTFGSRAAFRSRAPPPFQA
ncbi:MAG: hypothetical protein HZA63_12820 [Rhodocyclales bacterium]|nr:hypothetical protein [Rhodocyclales bacterium]